MNLQDLIYTIDDQELKSRFDTLRELEIIRDSLIIEVNKIIRYDNYRARMLQIAWNIVQQTLASEEAYLYSYLEGIKK